MAQPPNNVLAPETLFSIIDSCLKPTEENDTILGSSQDALALLSHSIMQSVGFRLIGLEEEDGSDSDHNITRDAEGNIVGLPKGWNSQSPNSYSFKYKHPQSSFTFLIKCMRLSNKFLIHGIGVEDNKTATLEVVTDDYTSPSFFPLTAEKYKTEPIVHGFISTSRVKDLVNLYQINIIQKLIPGLNKPGYEETGTTTTTANQPSGSRQQEPIYNDPLRIPTRQPPRFQPPIYDDPYGGDEPSSIINPFAVGRDDLNPNLPRFPPIGGVGGIGGIGGIGGPSGGGGMFVGPNHPMFGQRVPHRSNIYGGPQPLPRGSVPPGARFDPIGPFGSGRNQGGRGQRGPPSGEPDNDEVPPGYNDMFM